MGMGGRLGLAHYGLNWRKLFPLSFPFFFLISRFQKYKGHGFREG